MRIALAQQNYHIGNFENNTQKIISAIEQAKDKGADIIVFPELSVCGYPPLDFLEFDDFIDRCLTSVEIIKQHTDGIGVVIGAPQKNPESSGKRLFNSAWLLYNREIIGTAQKTLLPTYDILDEYRYFEPAFSWSVIPFKDCRIALTICEDIWNLGNNPLYRICPMDTLSRQMPDLMINISASPFDYSHSEARKEMIKANVLKYQLPLVYCNAVGAQTDIVFDGGSLVYNEKGDLLKEMEYFKEDFCVLDIGITNHPPELQNQHKGSPPATIKETNQELQEEKFKDPGMILNMLTSENNIRQIHKALLLGIHDYFSKMGFSKAILGSSGGIDSALALELACEALGAENVYAVLMPSPFSTTHSVKDAEQLSKNLGNPYEVLPIEPVYNSFLSTLKPLFKNLPFNVAEENIQSRSRGNLLMAIANKFGYILLNTSNKSELATGYGTLYGDMAGGLSVLGDVYKTQVYALAKYINRNREIIPEHIITKAPSAELRPNQKDSDSLPEYDVLDKLLYQYIENRLGPSEIIKMGIDPALVNRVLKLVNSNEYKRNQFCPIIRVSSKAFGTGRRMPVAGKYLT